MGELSDILGRLESLLGPFTGEPAELGGGITNRNFRASFGGRDYVIRRPGKDTELLGINREAERLATEAGALLGIAPAVAATLEDCLVTDFIACRSISSSELAEGAEEIAGALRAFHDSEVALPSDFRVPDLLEDYASIVLGRGGTLPALYTQAVDAAARITAALPAARPCPCHNDLLATNIIRALDGRMILVDWEYAGMGDARFDLANLSVNNHFEEGTDERLLTAYHGEAPSDGRRAALKLTRVLSDAREAAWGVVQAEVSELDFDFAGYADEHFERLQGAVEQRQFEQWLLSASGEPGGQAA